MKFKIFEKISQKVGQIAGHLVNETTQLKENIYLGYEKHRTKKCIWCKNEYPISELRAIVSGKYPMCNQCLEGLAAPEAMMSEKHKPHASQIINAMLARVAGDKEHYSPAFNSFIMEANITIDKLFPNIALPKQGEDTKNEK